MPAPSRLPSGSCSKTVFLLFKNYREECRAAGFRDIRDEVIGRFSTATDSSTVADMAREHGVELFYTQYLRLCTK